MIRWQRGNPGHWVIDRSAAGPRCGENTGITRHNGGLSAETGGCGIEPPGAPPAASGAAAASRYDLAPPKAQELLMQACAAVARLCDGLDAERMALAWLVAVDQLGPVDGTRGAERATSHGFPPGLYAGPDPFAHAEPQSKGADVGAFDEGEAVQGGTLSAVLRSVAALQREAGLLCEAAERTIGRSEDLVAARGRSAEDPDAPSVETLTAIYVGSVSELLRAVERARCAIALAGRFVPVPRPDASAPVPLPG